MVLTDAEAMGLALRRAKRGQGQTDDNPGVGCLVLSESGHVLALSHTAPGGRPHAEIEALMIAGPKARGSCVFVTLEPCVHHGRSGPCTDALIEAKVRRVVIGTSDANPKVSGQGVERLRAAGIEVDVLNDPGCVEHHLGFNRRINGGRPYLIMKIATSADGGMSLLDAAHPVKITGQDVQRQVHRLRAQSDMIITGKGTWEFDRPKLNVRLPGYVGHHPKICIWQRGMNIIELEANQVMIEAGPTLSSALFPEIDELHWYRSQESFGAKAIRPDFLTQTPLDFGEMWPKFNLQERRRFGTDIREIWKV